MQLEQAIKSWGEISAKALLAAVKDSEQAPSEPAELADDILKGAGPIASYVLGDDSQKSRRRIYHLSDPKRSDRLPVFRMGQIICARKSTIKKWIAAREAAG